MAEDKLTADRKALLVNLDPKTFGTFAEIGAGQEVARHFFRVGGAAGSIAKTMSAYDMTFSDSIYGKSGRYVSHERLLSMLQHEYNLLLERLSSKRGATTQFFVFADTVAAQNFKGTADCHGWLGIRFQSSFSGPPNDIVIHVRMKDKENLLQQQALGIVGVNLIYGAFFHRNDPNAFIASLLDELSIDRIEIDMIEFSGPDLSSIDNRLMSLKLVEHNLSNAAMFAPDRRVLQPSEILYKKPVLIERGSFRPVTHVNLDMLSCAKEFFLKEPGVREKDPVVLFEVTLNNLLSGGSLDTGDFLARADTLSALGHNVLISDYPEYYRLVNYLRRYTNEMIGVVIGINNLLQIFNDSFYESLEGGILEALGRLFRQRVKLYVYPMSREAYIEYVETSKLAVLPEDKNTVPEVVYAKDINVLPHLQPLYAYLLDTKAIEGVTGYKKEYLSIYSRKVLSQIPTQDKSWEKCVPAAAAEIIKNRKMFGYNS